MDVDKWLRACIIVLLVLLAVTVVGLLLAITGQL